MGSTRSNVAFIVSVVVGLAVFAAIVLPGSNGDSLTWTRLCTAGAALITTAPATAWILIRTLLK
ncbi:hypothetical protein [Streptomyces sp. NPDC058466]|uniref:hypothetical protein n=1 Tax=Streptomyces sp. NPDC058466 TaxID=3346512 RepID=UPI0036489AB4